LCLENDLDIGIAIIAVGHIDKRLDPNGAEFAIWKTAPQRPDCVAGVKDSNSEMSAFCNLGRTPWVYRAFSYQRLFADAGKRPIQIAPG